MRRRIVGAAVALLLVAAPLAVGVPAAVADDGKPIAIEAVHNKEVKQDYPGMAVNDASSNFTDPDSCSSFPWCTLVPVNITYPAGFDKAGDNILVISVSWDSGPPQTSGLRQTNDLDLYVYEGTKQADGTYKQSGKSTTGDENPELVRVFNPNLPTYYAVVYNSLGPNKGFTVDVRFVVGSFDTTEHLPPAPGSGSSSGSGGSSAATAPTAKPSSPSNPSGPASPSFLPQPGPVLTTSLTDAAVAPDPDLDTGFADAKAFEAQLRNPAGTSDLDLLAASRRRSGPPKSVPGVLLLFWLAVVPLILGGGVVLWLARRRPAALTLGVSG